MIDNKSIVINSKCIVFCAEESGESSLHVAMLAERLGYIWCLAQGAREVSSKQRLHLKPFSVIEAAIVSGARVRVRSALETTPFASILLARENGAQALSAVSRVCTMVRRITPPRESDPHIFGIVENFLYAVSTGTAKDLSSLELLAVFRILHALGYIGESSRSELLLDSQNYGSELLQDVGARRSELLQTVNGALSASML